MHGCQAMHHPVVEDRPTMLTQYVYPSKTGLFRIIRHGRQWRALCEELEIGRHETAEAALIAARIACPQARLPGELGQWRYLPELALAHSRVSGEGGTRVEFVLPSGRPEGSPWGREDWGEGPILRYRQVEACSE
jgi:hypothetical protein